MQNNISKILDKLPFACISIDKNKKVEPRTVDVHVRRLRKVLNTNNKKDYIRTVRSAGYSFGHN